MADKLTGDDLKAAVEAANEKGAGIDDGATADEKRAALDEFNGGSQEEAAPVSQPSSPEAVDNLDNDEKADAGYTEEDAPTTDDGPTEEELEARRAAAIGSGTGYTPGPSQADLNPAYAHDVTEG